MHPLWARRGIPLTDNFGLRTCRWPGPNSLEQPKTLPSPVLPPPCSPPPGVKPTAWFEGSAHLHLLLFCPWLHLLHVWSCLRISFMADPTWNECALLWVLLSRSHFFTLLLHEASQLTSYIKTPPSDATTVSSISSEALMVRSSCELPCFVSISWEETFLVSSRGHFNLDSCKRHSFLCYIWLSETHSKSRCCLLFLPFGVGYLFSNCSVLEEYPGFLIISFMDKAVFPCQLQTFLKPSCLLLWLGQNPKQKPCVRWTWTPFSSLPLFHLHRKSRGGDLLKATLFYWLPLLIPCPCWCFLKSLPKQTSCTGMSGDPKLI